MKLKDVKSINQLTEARFRLFVLSNKLHIKDYLYIKGRIEQVIKRLRRNDETK
jgi:hypothetical protein